jgi:hypothetical protein
MCCALVGPSTAVAAPKAAPADQQRKVEQFWDAFREAVRTSNRVALLRLTNFPFVVRFGNADSNDPTETYDRDGFQRLVDRLLSLKITGDSGKTMVQVIDATEHVEDPEVSSGTFMVDCFEFRMVKGSWRWTAVFTADPAFYSTSDSDPIPRVSPLRKFILDLTSNTAHLRRPLIVKHLRTTGRVAYLEAQEPGKGGRTVRSFLERQADDPRGEMAWVVKDYSFQPPDGAEDGWDGRLDKLVKSGVPASLFPARVSNQEARNRAR